MYMETNNTLEENIKVIEGIVEKIEEGNVTLEESIILYKEGISILEKCNTKIETIEKELIIIKDQNKV
ncbi:MAG: exodeoxyribonuclease VII small subunit [Firmicutes bacterium HGW-Firmicutes-7]|nr:MAG: exodeoxyribonuclease VII small subunit [Firmicutes bacterium HGW-Firmicutes-7]